MVLKSPGKLPGCQEDPNIGKISAPTQSLPLPLMPNLLFASFKISISSLDCGSLTPTQNILDRL